MKKLVLLISLVLSSPWALAASDEGPISTKQGHTRPAIAVEAGVYKPFFRDKGESDQPVGPLLIDATPVTNAEYKAFLTTEPGWRRSRVKKVFATQGYLRHWRGDLDFDPAIADHPVVNVTWFTARKFCAAQGKRLLTVAEWEYAADPFAIGTTEKILAWYTRPDTGLRPVGAEPPNKFGLRDMHGLIWEWVENYSSVIVAGDSRDSNEAAGAKFCGAGSLTAKDPNQYATFMRFAFRSSLSGAYSGAALGFRCARDIGSAKEE